MFNKLLLTQVVTQVQPIAAVESISQDSLVEALIELSAAQDDFVAFESIDTTINDLYSLQSAIKSFGITKSLLSFADADLNLSTCITSFPALEGLSVDLVPTSDESKAALEGVMGTVKEALIRWAAKAYDVAINGLSAAGNVAAEWSKRFIALVGKATAHMYSEAKAKKTETTAPTAKVVEKILGYMKEIPEKIKMMWSKPLREEGSTEDFTQDHSEILAVLASLEAAGDSDYAQYYRVDKSESETTADKLGYTQELYNKVFAWLKAFAAGTIPVFFKSVGEAIKRNIESIKSATGPAATMMRKALAERLKATWKMIRVDFLRGLATVYKAAMTLFKSSEPKTV